MKRFLGMVAILLAPIIAYFALFIAFEPNNYFNLRKSSQSADIMAALRQYNKNGEDAIILGDSRTAKLNLQQAEKITGKKWTNLSYGGASLKEQMDLAKWALEANPNINEIVFAISFYTLNKAYSHNRNVVAAAKDPFIYITNLGYNLNMLTNLQDHLSGRTTGADAETMSPTDYEYTTFKNPATGNTVKLRKTIAGHLNNLLPYSKNWVLNQTHLDELLKLIKECEENNVALTLVFPPAHEDVISQIVKAFGIDEKMQPALLALNSSSANVLDYELFNRPMLLDDQFYDGFHLDEERGVAQWSEMLFTDIARSAKT